MSSGVLIKKLVRKIEALGLPVLFGVCFSLMLFALGFWLIYGGGHFVFASLLVYLAMVVLVFTKSKSFGSHTARLSAALAFCCFGRIFSFFVSKGESSWYGDCWVPDGGFLEIGGFFSVLLAYVVYFIVKNVVRKKFLLDCSSESRSSLVSGCVQLCDDSNNIFSRIVLFLDKLKLPRNFGLGLFVICVLGHIFLVLLMHIFIMLASITLVLKG